MSQSLNIKIKPLYIAIQFVLLGSAFVMQQTYAVGNSTNIGDSLDDSQQLPTIALKANEGAITENSRSYTAVSSNTATKLVLSSRDTPQTVKVYTRQYLDDRNIKSFQELMNVVTGVTVSRTDERQSYFARGFQIDYYLVDGLPSTLSLAEGDPDLSIYDRVEVVKGANGLMTGAGNPALGLNLIRKHANSKELTGSINTSVGSWNNISSSIDISAPLNTDGSLRGRTFVKHSDEESFMDFYSKQRNVFYGALDYDLSDQTSLSLAASYQQLERDGIRWGGLPAFYSDGTPTNFDRGLTVSSDWTYWDVDSKAFFASLKHKLFQDVDLNVAYTYRRDDKQSALLYIAGNVDKVTNKSLGALSVYSSDVRNDENNLDLYISAPFNIANRKQEIVFGGSWNKNEILKNNYGTIQGKSDGTNDLDINVKELDFSNMNTQLLTPVRNPKTLALNETVQTGVYLAGKFHLLDPLKLVTGARLSNWEFNASDSKGNREFNNQLTTYVGLIYDVAADHSVYASYTDIFKPQNRRDEGGNYLDPSVGANYETGIKSEFLNGLLNTALSVFRIEQSNYAEEISGAFVYENGIKTAEKAYRSVDGVVSKGIEFEVDGEVNDHWSVNFGVAKFQAKDAKGNKVNTNNSRTTSNLFTKYKMGQWSAGAGLSYRSKAYTYSPEKWLIEQGDIWLANIMLGYQIDPNVKVQLNVDNLFDKNYYDGIGTNSMNYASSRNATLSLSYDF